MPESAARWHARVTDAFASEGPRAVPWTSWPTWPFVEQSLTARPLEPLGEEQARRGAGGTECEICERRSDTSYIVWHDDLVMLGAPFGPTSLPIVVFLMPRRHADLSDLTPEEAARMGQVMVAAEQAACAVLDVPRLQMFRWGDGAEHLHWWLIGRPTGANQLRGTFLPLWDDVLPARDPADLRADLDAVAVRLVELAGGTNSSIPSA